MNISLRRIMSIMHARNLEFVRDRSSLSWNVILPLFLVIGLYMVFSGPERPIFKVGVHTEKPLIQEAHPFMNTRYIDFYRVKGLQDARQKVARHQTDMLLDLTVEPAQYWVNTSSPKGYFLERLFWISSHTEAISYDQRQSIEGEQIPYTDWVLPGVLGMNIMFSCLFGVGYVIVRYRKSGYLRRLNATPLKAIEFVIAQVLSRLIIIMIITVAMYATLQITIGFRMNGGHLPLLVITLLGATSMIALGLAVAARVTSEELAGGVLNFFTWPMMFLSGVWFSLEGAAEEIKILAQGLPLTHLLDGARAIMIDGAGWDEIMLHLVVLAGMTVVFMLIGAGMFKWDQE